MGMIWTAYRVDDEQASDLAQRLAASTADGASVGEALEQAGQALDVDKAWHALDTLYSTAGATSPISTGRLPDSDDTTDDDAVVGRVPAARVTAIVAGMGRITPAILKRGYDAKRFAREHVYPEIWDEDDVLDVYVMPYDAELREFYHTAAEAGQAVVWRLN